MNTPPTPYDYLMEEKPVYYGNELVGYKVNDPSSIDDKRFYYLKDLNEIINQRIIASKKKDYEGNTIGSGGSHKRSRRHSKKQKRVRYTRRKQTRRHRHSRRR